MTPRLILIIYVGAILTPAAEKPVILRYTFTPDFATSGSSLHVVLTFQGSEAGNSKLILPTTWAGQSDLFKAVRNLKSEDSITVIRNTDADGVRNPLPAGLKGQSEN